ncbi:MAG: SPW repeat domain-containing protein [Janthinobacterium lividum]
MLQFISRRQHAFTDYSYVPLVAAAPDLVGFTEEKTATTLCHVLSTSILVSSLFTRAEWGPIRVIPYKAHLALDTLGGLTALTAPWVFGFAQHKKARNTFLVMGVFGLIAGLLSKPEEMPAHPQPLLN